MKTWVVEKLKHISQNKSLYFLILLAFGEIAVWFYVMLSKQYVMDCDTAKVMYHAEQMWKSRTLVIKNWKSVSTLEWDCAVFWALPIYGITKNIIFAYSVANIMNLFLFLAVIGELFCSLKLRPQFFLLTISAILIPYNWGMLEYSNMLFYSSQQYIFKVLLPIWLIAIYHVPENRKKSGLNILQIGLWWTLLVSNAFSSGIYVFCVALMPVMICYVVGVLGRERKPELYSVIVTALTIIGVAVGWRMQRVFGIVNRSETMMMVSADDIWKQFEHFAVEFLNVWGVFPHESVLLYSMESIVSVLKLAFLLALFVLSLRCSNHLFFLNAQFKGNMDDKRTEATAQLISVFWWNSLIVFLTAISSRYLLIGVIPLMLLGGVQLGFFLEKCEKAILYKLIVYGLGGYLLLLCGLLWIEAKEYLCMDNHEYAREIIQYADIYNTDTVVFINNPEISEIVRVFDPDRVYLTYYSGEENMNLVVTYDDYADHQDRAGQTDRNLIIGNIKGSFGEIPGYIAKCYTEVGIIGEEGDPDFSKIYFSDKNYFDSGVGLNGKKFAMDLPISKGYSYGGGLLISPVYSAEKYPYDITISYSLTGDEAVAKVTLTAGEEVTEQSISGDQSEAILHVDGGKEAFFRMETSDGKPITIDGIRFQRSQDK